MHELTFTSSVLIAAAGIVFGSTQWRKAQSLRRQLAQLTAQIEETRAQLSAANAQLLVARSNQANEINRVLHEVKSPLTAILCLSSFLKHTLTNLTSKEEHFLDLIEADVKKLFSLLSHTAEPTGDQRRDLQHNAQTTDS